jgi:hypothetical protein
MPEAAPLLLAAPVPVAVAVELPLELAAFVADEEPEAAELEGEEPDSTFSVRTPPETPPGGAELEAFLAPAL